MSRVAFLPKAQAAFLHKVQAAVRRLDRVSQEPADRCGGPVASSP